MRQVSRLPLRALAAAAVLSFTLPALAQLSSATVRGSVSAGATARAGATVTAVNTATGQTTRTTSRADGSYVLVGLVPGHYRIEIAAPGYKPRVETLTVLIGQTLDLDASLIASTAATQTITVVGANTSDRRTSEVATNVDPKMMQALPQNSRNFLSYADIAPGVRFDVDPASGQAYLRGGAQNTDDINVFIDGVSQKNYILRGGVSGGDSTRGNPIQQSAIAEDQVLSSNYKAEFDQVSSTAIVAVTKSGTNHFHGDVWIDRGSSSWTALTPAQQQLKASGQPIVPSTQTQYGFSLGGPIKRDVAHFFVAVEAKDIGSSRSVLAQNASNLPHAGIVPGLLAQQGSVPSDFKEQLFFGKVDVDPDERQHLEFTARVRAESDKAFPESTNLSVAGNIKNRTNDETRLNVKHSYSGDTFLNELNVGYESYEWHPHSSSNTPFIKYQYSSTNTFPAQDVLYTGGSPDAQDRKQSAPLLQDDLTYTGLTGHTMKGGVKVKAATFNLSGTSQSVDTVTAIIDNQTGQPYYDASSGNCTSAAPAPGDTPTNTASCMITRAIPAVQLNYKDTMFGMYFQDDWDVSKQLELNLGMRWDYETNMLDDKYVTPGDRVAMFSIQDPRAGAPAGQTYAQSLAKGGVNIYDYLSNGSNRKDFTGALAPRLGFSYDLVGDRSRVVFGGFGRAYDRANANHALDEVYHNSTPNTGDTFLIKNNHKMPYSDQFSLGLRQGFGAWNGEIGATSVRGHNQFVWFNGNRDPQGGWGTQSPIDPLWGSVLGFGNLVLGDFVVETRTQSVYLKLEKPYTRASGWGVAATYTYSDGQTTQGNWNDDIFSWTQGKPYNGFHPDVNVERQRLVATGVSDRLLPWGIQVAGKLTLGSGLPYQITDCAGGWSQCVYVKGQASAFRQVDFALSKAIATGFGHVILRADILNLFNTINNAGYDGWAGGPTATPANYLGGDNAHLGVPSGLQGPTRTVKLSLRYAF
ncbi:MAG: TonB-dependent receptor [Burkholderiales bacterium]|nr:TonB-dependent receptor [Burkholderiales bacterium]